MKIQEITSEKFKLKEIQVGDVFTEMYSFFIYVIKIQDDGTIITLEGSNPGIIKEYKDFDVFEKKCSYKSIDGYWIDYIGCDTNATGKRIECYKKYKQDYSKAFESLPDINGNKKVNKKGREFKIDTIIYDL